MSNDLTAIAHRLAIMDAMYRYCRSMDRMDHELGYGVWHEDGTADYGPLFRGSGRDFVDWACEHHRPMIAHAHRVSNILIDLRGDTAGSESYVTVSLRLNAGGQLEEVTVHGRYLDRWSRRAGRWAIDHRVYVHDFDARHAISAIALEGWGRRDREDPSYAVLGPIG